METRRYMAVPEKTIWCKGLRSNGMGVCGAERRLLNKLFGEQGGSVDESSYAR